MVSSGLDGMPVSSLPNHEEYHPASKERIFKQRHSPQSEEVELYCVWALKQTITRSVQHHMDLMNPLALALSFTILSVGAWLQAAETFLKFFLQIPCLKLPFEQHGRFAQGVFGES